jgi:hypothetical protein
MLQASRTARGGRDHTVVLDLRRSEQADYERRHDSTIVTRVPGRMFDLRGIQCND